MKISTRQIDAIFGPSPFIARRTLDKTRFEVTYEPDERWRKTGPNKHHGFFETYEIAEKHQQRLHVRWVLGRT